MRNKKKRGKSRKQRSSEHSGEAKKLRTIKARSRETEIQKKCTKRENIITQKNSPPH
jgi:hypothetical protein